MGLFSALLMFATGVCLPSFDVYTDISFAAQRFTGSYSRCGYARPHPIYACAMLAPVLLSWMFVARHWYRTERGAWQKLLTFPLLILQLYPQYRALRVLFHAKWKGTSGWQRMKDEWEMEISHLGEDILGGAVTWVRGFVKCFLRVPPLYCSLPAAQTRKRSSQKIFNKISYPRNGQSHTPSAT